MHRLVRKVLVPGRFIVSVTLVVTLVACGGGDGGNDNGGGGSGGTTEPPPPPTTGTLAVTTATSGAAQDVDGYAVAVDGGTAQAVGTSSALVIRELAAGSHAVQLTGVAANCDVTGDNPLTVTVVAGNTAAAAFAITCRAGRLAFTSRRSGATNSDGSLEVFTMNPDGTDVQQVTESPFDSFTPRWSPDGTKVAFMRLSQVYVIDVETHGETQLTNSLGAQPTWSPDGTRIAFVGEVANWTQIFTMDAATGDDIQRVTSDATNHEFPEWSPDGTRIAFQTGLNGNQDIYVINVGGDDPAQLTTNISFDGSPAWSPDGVWVAYFTDYAGPYDLKRFRVAEGDAGADELTYVATEIDGTPAWSPDGKQVAYCSKGTLRVFTLATGQSADVNNNDVETTCYVDWGP